MTKLFKKRTKKIGVPPGTLVHIGQIEPEKVHISLFDYGPRRLEERKECSLEDCLQIMNMATTTWIHVSGVNDPEIVAKIGEKLKLHPLLLEDILNTDQRPKLEDYKDYLFIVTRSLSYDDAKQEIVDQQVSMILGKHFLLTFTESDFDIFASVKNRLRAESSRMRGYGPDYLLYTLIDSIVDHYFVILEKEDEKLDLIDKDLLNNPKKNVLLEIEKLKREVIILRKQIWPMREMTGHFLRLDSPLITQNTKTFMQDVYDHTIQAIETIEGMRDVAAGMIEIYQSTINQKLNEIIKFLTMVSTIFVPLTFISSMYGMNFEHMPELKWRWGYPLVLFLMAATAVSMLYIFRRRKWL